MSHHRCFITYGSRLNTRLHISRATNGSYGQVYVTSSVCSAQRQVFHCKRSNKGCSSAEGNSSTANSETKIAVLLVMNMCSSFLLLSTPSLSLSSEQTSKDLKRSQGPQGGGGEREFGITGPSGLHRYSPEGLNISCIRVFDHIRDLEIPITLRPFIETI